MSQQVTIKRLTIKTEDGWTEDHSANDTEWDASRDLQDLARVSRDRPAKPGMKLIDGTERKHVLATRLQQAARFKESKTMNNVAHEPPVS